MEMDSLPEMFVPEKPSRMDYVDARTHAAYEVPRSHSREMKMSPDKRYEQNRGDMEEWDSSRDGSHPGTPMTRTGKRKASECDRQPESPPEIERQHAPNNWHREKHYRSHQEHMDMDSPASYPKHVMVPDQRYSRSNSHSYHDTPTAASNSSKVTTPLLTNDHGGHGGYEHPTYRPSSNYYNGHHGYYDEHYQGHTPPRESKHYLPDMETSPSYAPPHHQQPDVYMRPRRWACDYCNVATFSSYEEACAHEDACARQYHERYGVQPHQSRGPIPQYDRPPSQSHHHGSNGNGNGLGTLYHASQEAPVPSTAHRQPAWNTPRGPPMPHLPHESHQGTPPAHHHQQQYQHHPHHQSHHYQHHGGYQTPPRYPGYREYHNRDTPGSHPHHGHPHHYPHQAHHNQHHHGHYPHPRHHHDPYNMKPQQKRMLLAMPTDSDSLSDRQCYVRSEMVEIFAASSKDVAARHSKGAQKLVEGQVGIRCVHCSHLRPRDRAERAVCYPSSISRIYQTVADMQRFHFEQCREIPAETRKIYKNLKTTRPRGVGSPQTYWIQSAKLLDLIDSGDGIRFSADLKREQQQLEQQQREQQQPQQQQQVEQNQPPDQQNQQQTKQEQSQPQQEPHIEASENTAV